MTSSSVCQPSVHQPTIDYLSTKPQHGSILPNQITPHFAALTPRSGSSAKILKSKLQPWFAKVLLPPVAIPVTIKYVKSINQYWNYSNLTTWKITHATNYATNIAQAPPQPTDTITAPFICWVSKTPPIIAMSCERLTADRCPISLSCRMASSG